MDAGDALRKALEVRQEEKAASAATRDRLSREREDYAAREREVKHRLYEAAALMLAKLTESGTAERIPIGQKRPGLAGVLRQRQEVDGWRVQLYVENFILSVDGVLIRPSTISYSSHETLPLSRWIDQKIQAARRFSSGESSPGLFEQAFEGSSVNEPARESLYSHLSQANDLVIRSFAQVLDERELSI